MKNIIITLLLIIVVGMAAYLYTQRSGEQQINTNEEQTQEPDGSEQAQDDEGTTTPLVVDKDETQTIIGQTVESRDIVAYHYGSGDKEVLFIGGMHGGYSWNTALLGMELKEYMDTHEDIVPSDVTVTVIPVLNLDGLNTTVGTTDMFTEADVPTVTNATVPGRFNANNVDLNRNFDCEWQEEGTWQNRTVSGGDAPFSEPEAAAVRDYVTENNIAAAVVYYSQAGGVYASTCTGEITDATRELTNTYAQASGYDAFEEFDYYEITGDAVNWMAGEGIPAISVLLTNHEDTEWEKNLDGIEATLTYISEE